MKNSSRFIVAGLVIAWAVDLFFYDKPFGIAYTIWVCLALLLLFILAALENAKPAPQTIVLAVLTVTFALGPLFRLEPFTRFLSSVTALLGLMLVTATFRHGHWPWYKIVDYFLAFLDLIGAAFSRAISIFSRPKETTEQDLSDPENSVTDPPKKLPWSIVRGIVLAFPVILILASLLAAADPIFGEKLQNFLDLFDIENLLEYGFRLFYILVFAYLFTGVLLHAVCPKKEAKKPDPSKPWIKPFLGNIETTIILASVNALFLAFLVIQFRYFFGGEANISATGFTYSEYARRGFGELITVAVLSLLLYLGLQSITNLREKKQAARFTLLTCLLFVQVLIMLYSSFLRLGLYESAYGFSRLRTQSTVLIPWLAVMIAVVMVLEIIKKQGYFALLFVTTFLGFTATMILINQDAFIAKKNIERATISNQEGYALDYPYLYSLTNDAVPVVLDAYLNGPQVVRNPSAAFLACRWNEISKKGEQPWQGFNLSDQTAYTLLNSYRIEWENYPITEKDEAYFNGYVTVAGSKYPCSSYFFSMTEPRP